MIQRRGGRAQSVRPPCTIYAEWMHHFSGGCAPQGAVSPHPWGGIFINDQLVLTRASWLPFICSVDCVFGGVGVGRYQPFFVGSNKPFFVGNIRTNQDDISCQQPRLAKVILAGQPTAQRPSLYLNNNALTSLDYRGQQVSLQRSGLHLPLSY